MYDVARDTCNIFDSSTVQTLHQRIRRSTVPHEDDHLVRQRGLDDFFGRLQLGTVRELLAEQVHAGRHLSQADQVDCHVRRDDGLTVGQFCEEVVGEVVVNLALAG